MNTKITILAPENELPAEGADVTPIAAESEPAASDLLAAYSSLLESSTISFAVSAEGEIDLGETPEVEPLVRLDVSADGTPEPNFTIDPAQPTATLDLSAAAAAVADPFDADDGVRKMVAALASGMGANVSDGAGQPVPLVRWHKNEGDSAGGVAQVLGVWLADEGQLEALRSGGGEGIIFDEAEVEGRGLRESLTALTVLGVMMGGSVSAEAGLFFRRASKEKPKASQESQRYRQDPVHVDQRALAQADSDDTMVVVDVSKQRAYLMANGRVIMDTPVSTARQGKHTPRGEFQITQRVASGKTSTIYGCDLPYWMRLDQSAIGLHVGDLPGYPASAGCIRLPSNVAPVLFRMTERGTTVKVVDSWAPAAVLASR